MWNSYEKVIPRYSYFVGLRLPVLVLPLELLIEVVEQREPLVLEVLKVSFTMLL